MKYTTTLQRLRNNQACARCYNLIASHIGSDFEGEIDLLTILDVSGLVDCVRAMRTADGGGELAIAFAIYCAHRIYKEPTWVAWAGKWMSGEDRTIKSAEEAAWVAVRNPCDQIYIVEVAAWAARSAAWEGQASAWAAERAIDLSKVNTGLHWRAKTLRRILDDEEQKED